MLDTERYSSILADSLPKKLVRFRGIKQRQGDGQYCVRFNTRLMPSLRPAVSEDVSSDEWKQFEVLQRYTDGEAFFLCYPAAVIFGLLNKAGRTCLPFQFSWIDHYKRSQDFACKKTDPNRDIDPSTAFAGKVRESLIVEDYEFTSAGQLVSFLSSPSALEAGAICLVQMACAYPMFGDKLFGHYVAVTDCRSDCVVTIAGGLGPFGIYESLLATVNLDELAFFAATSTRIQRKLRKGLNLNLRDTASGGGFEVMAMRPNLS